MTKKPSKPAINLNRRARHDGWTAARIEQFLETLGKTGCVRDAARVVGLSSTSAYRLRAEAADFAQAWDAALTGAQKGLIAIAYQRAVEGKETIIIRKGEEVERRISPSDAMLGMLVKRGDLEGKRDAEAATNISFAEHQEGWKFDPDGQKKKGESPAKREILADKVTAKLYSMRAAYCRMSAEEPHCRICGGPATEALRAKFLAEADHYQALSEKALQGDRTTAHDLTRPIGGVPSRAPR
jgi:hypothetical protein